MGEEGRGWEGKGKREGEKRRIDRPPCIVMGNKLKIKLRLQSEEV